MPHIRRRAPRLLALLSWPLLAASLAPATAAQGQAAGKSLEQLRTEYAVRFLEPDSHMALAKYFRDKGNPIQAFLLLESARRGYFEQKDFDAAFKTHFLGLPPFDNSPAAEARLLSELARDPASHDALTGLADIYISREDYAKAKEYLRKAIALRPGEFAETEALAEVLRREQKDEEAKKLLRDWAGRHPETAEAYAIRMLDIPEGEPDRLRALLVEAAARFPREARFPFRHAALLQRAGDAKGAEELYVRAAELAPRSAYVQTWVGRFFFKMKGDEARALGYYLNAYLLDPHAYETEYVESRIPKISGKLAEARFQELQKQGVALAKIAEDPNPFVVMDALKQMGEKWRPEYQRAAVRLMAHDDTGVRWRAAQLLKGKAGPSFDAELKALLADGDLRRRGLAAYLAVHRWKAKSFALMRAMLREEAQLLRYDAASALIMEGGPEGRRIALGHRPREPHPRLRRILEAAAKGTTEQ